MRREPGLEIGWREPVALGRGDTVLLRGRAEHLGAGRERDFTRCVKGVGVTLLHDPVRRQGSISGIELGDGFRGASTGGVDAMTLTI